MVTVRALLIFTLGAILGIVFYPMLRDEQASQESLLGGASATVASPVLASQNASEEIAASRRNAIVRAVEKVAPAVVSINTTRVKEYSVGYRDAFFDFFYPYKTVLKKIPGIGSGFVIQEDGYILTNHHVVEGAREISVTFSDGQTFKVTDIRNDVMVDRQTDLAVIRILADDLPVVELGNSDNVIIGEWAIAIGNPFGLMIEDPKPTVTVGVVSAINRDFQPEEDGRIYQGMIQTDASINPGNSGGPLVNSVGRVIGVNTFIFSESGGSHGIGFALPVNRAAEVARQLIERGSQEFWTGITIHNMNWRIARELGLPTDKGALITAVEADSPGERAGLRPADVILEVNGYEARNANDVVEAFREGRVGDIFNLLILRGRRFLREKLTLEQAPSS